MNNKEFEALNVLSHIAKTTNVFYQEDNQDLKNYVGRINYHKDIIEHALNEKEDLKKAFAVLVKCSMLDDEDIFYDEEYGYFIFGEKVSEDEYNLVKKYLTSLKKPV